MTTTSARIPLPRRITYYLRRTPGPQHYRVIARHLRTTYLRTYRACQRMLHDGRLRGVDVGTYVLREEGTP